MQADTIYNPKNNIRIITAGSLFDGHDAAINIMRRIIQASGAEVIHLGHNRSVKEVVDAAIQEDVQGIALTSYQGGHMEYFKYMFDMLKKRKMGHIKIFGGGGGTILPEEIAELEAYGIYKIFSPDDGRKVGLQGMINELMEACDYSLKSQFNGELKKISDRNPNIIAKAITLVESYPRDSKKLISELKKASLTQSNPVPVLGVTGTGGAGKSSVVDELVRRYLNEFKNNTVAIICVDPSKRKTGGALLGDRIRMNAINTDRVYMRSLATRQTNFALSKAIDEATNICKAAGFDWIIVESSGIGQADTEITNYCDVSLYVMTPEYGAATQLEKINMLDYADVIAINKFDKPGAEDALKDVRKQYKRNHNLFKAKDQDLPVYQTIASQFNDGGVNNLYKNLLDIIATKTGRDFRSNQKFKNNTTNKAYIIPPSRVRYLAEIAETIYDYDKWVDEQSEIAQQLYQLKGAIALTKQAKDKKPLQALYKSHENKLDPECKKVLDGWPNKLKKFEKENLEFQVRGKTIKIPLTVETLSHTRIRKIVLPKYKAWGDILRWVLTENIPGEYPFAAGVYPLKRESEDPTRMFAGEGSPERTNKRFHYVSIDQPAKRLSTAFDSVTLYGEDPDKRPDIYGKIGNAGVSIATLDDAKKLYSGFDLIDPKTSVSMTINGPAPIILAFFMNAAIDQQCEKYIHDKKLTRSVQAKIKKIFKQKGVSQPTYKGNLPVGNNGRGTMLLGITGDQVLPKSVYEKIKRDTLSKVRGTVQADILKEDQAQNTCIFSTEFALKMMGDVQEYFIEKNIRNFYSVSISGYHIAEAGSNPITQLAFTLANGFTYVEYYLSRGMNINDFAPNLSFFFSNGMDPEYAVIGRVARKIWAKAMRIKYGANERSQMLKYHIQTSGRSLHAQEINFNDIRTTLQALYAIYDNCNSLHTNAYDEAITTPTEESVRRAIAIQLIINKELGLAKNQNPLQGSFIIEELTDLVEEAVLSEFNSISERGGVLGAMEWMYQRSKIQEESLYYESQKVSGDLPLVGVNTFFGKDGSPIIRPKQIIRSTEEEKRHQIFTLNNVHKINKDTSKDSLEALKKTALNNENIFASLLEVSKNCSLGEMANALYAVGGQYRRNM
ncbi:MAG: methylmalonyl-CoA mutase family protein [Bacteroidetes bacterium]|nr:methylmalonyl-CoA mutase family protein [Bacteroidota bacterium]